MALLEAAADDASARLTHEAAGRHFREAAALIDDLDERARLTLASGHAYQRAGDLVAARDLYEGLLNNAVAETRGPGALGAPPARGSRSKGRALRCRPPA